MSPPPVASHADEHVQAHPAEVRSQTGRTRWRLRAWAWLLIAAAAIVPFLAVLPAGFVADDFLAVSRYRDADADVPPLRFAIDAVLTMARVPTTFYRPLAFVSIWVETRLWGAWALPFHLTNLLLHAAVCLLAFALVRRETGFHSLAGLMAIVLFALFPRRVEAVAWISCRPDLLAAAFAVAACLVYAKALRRPARASLDATDTAAAGPAFRAIGMSSAAAALWFLSLLSKESALLLPAALWALPHPPPRTRRALAIPFAVAFALYLTLRRTALGMWIGGYGATVLKPSPIELLVSARHVAYLLLPPIAPADDAIWVVRLATVVIALLLSLLAWRTFVSRRDPLVRFGAAWLAATVLPVAALQVSLATTFNDRLLYLPGVGMACLLAGLLARLSPRALLLWTLPLALLFGADTVRTTQRWRVASDLSDTLIRRLVAEIKAAWPDAPDTAPPAARTLHLAAVPDSYRGAYMLRTAIPDALRVAGLDSVPNVIILSRYFVDDARVVTVTASRKRAGAVTVDSCGDRPALLGDPSSMPFAVIETARPEGLDRYGRFTRRQANVPEDGRVLLLTPLRIESVITGAPALACGPVP